MSKDRRPKGRLLLLAASAAASLLFCSNFPGLRLFTPTSGVPSTVRPSLRLQAAWPALSAQGEADVAAAPAMTEAAVYMTDVDVITGELDISVLPEEMGVYAIFNTQGKLEYIGLSRNIQKSVDAHAKAIGLQEVGDLIATVKCAEMPGQSKELLKEVWQDWIQEHMDGGGEIPAGNMPENAPGADPRWRSRGAQAKGSLNLGGVGGIFSRADADRAVKEAIEKYPVILFMKGTPAMPQCGFSAKTSGYLRESGVEYESVNVLDNAQNPGVRDAVKEFGKWPTIPQLYVGGQLIGGADIVTEMALTGQLKKVLQDAVQGKKASSSEDASSAQKQYERGRIELIDDARRPTATALCQALNDNFDLYGLRVVDQSAAHEGDAGALEMGLTGESHFKVEIVAPEFDGVLPVQRQKKVFEVLSALMPRIHALSLVTRTPAEAA